MPKIIKLGMFLLIPIVLASAIGYGLLKMNILPGHKWAAEKGPMGVAMKLLKIKPLAKKKVETASAQQAATQAEDPLAAEKQALNAEQQAFNLEKSNWEAQQQQQQQAALHPAAPPVDPAQISRLAEIYGNMDSATIIKIFNKLPPEEVVDLLRQMGSRKVAHVLAGMDPVKAATLTQQLSQAPPTPPAASTDATSMQ